MKNSKTFPTVRINFEVNLLVDDSASLIDEMQNKYNADAVLTEKVDDPSTPRTFNISFAVRSMDDVKRLELLGRKLILHDAVTNLLIKAGSYDTLFDSTESDSKTTEEKFCSRLVSQITTRYRVQIRNIDVVSVTFLSEIDPFMQDPSYNLLNGQPFHNLRYTMADEKTEQFINVLKRHGISAHLQKTKYFHNTDSTSIIEDVVMITTGNPKVFNNVSINTGSENRFNMNGDFTLAQIIHAFINLPMEYKSR